MKISMTPTAIHSLIIRGTRYEAKDKDNTGLIIRVGANGTKKWGFRSRIKTGIKGHSPEYRDSFGDVVVGVGGKPDRSNIAKAKEWASNLKALTQAGTDPREERTKAHNAPTLNDVWNMYRNSRQSLKKAKSSQEADERLWRLHIAPTFSFQKVASITVPLIANFYDVKKASGRNASQIMALLSAIMSKAVRNGVIPSNPCREIKREKETPIEWERLETSEERNALLRAAYEHSDEAGLIVEAALITGARKQEILKARWEDITPKDDGQGLWRIQNTKQKRPHRINLPPNLYKNLQRWQSREGVIRVKGWVFPSTTKEDTPREDVKRFFTTIKNQIGKPRLRFHDLRHDFGTQLALQGMKATDIMAAMGHASIQTTMRYIHLAEAEAASEATNIREREMLRAVAFPHKSGPF